MRNFLEYAAWTLGSVCLLIWGTASAHQYFGAQASIRAFEEKLERHESAGSASSNELSAISKSDNQVKPAARYDQTENTATLIPTETDQTLWSASRVKHFADTLSSQTNPEPVALLSIPSVNLKVPVFEGDSEIALNLGAGVIPGTDPIDTEGNTGLAGHRDGYFRALKDVEIGDQIIVRTENSVSTYQIQKTWIVDPTETDSLNLTAEPALTLVTCYPFYFLGSAPKRFIVRANRVSKSTNLY